MKSFFLLIVITMCCNPRGRIIEPYIHKIVSDFDKHSYYLSVSIKNKDKIQVIVIENNRLYKTLNYNKLIYIKKISYSISHNSPIKVSMRIYENLEIYKIIPADTLKFITINGTSEVLKTFFKYNGYYKTYVLDTGISANVSNTIIYSLISKKYLCKIDDESGLLTADKFN